MGQNVSPFYVTVVMAYLELGLYDITDIKDMAQNLGKDLKRNGEDISMTVLSTGILA